MATIKDIAEQAGVSRGTVDRVLHNRPGVNKEVSLKVKTIAKDMGYKTNRAGRLLAAKKKPLKVGCLLPDIGNNFFESIIKGFEKAYDENKDFGLTYIISHIKGFEVLSHLKEIDNLVEQNCDALLLTTIDHPLIIKKINALIDSGISVACVNTDIPKSKRLFYVGADYFKSGQTCAGILNLMTKTKREILLLNGSYKMFGHNERLKGFIDTLDKNNIDYHIVEKDETLDDIERAYHITKKALIKYPEINTIYLGAGGSDGVGKAVLEERSDNKPIVLCFDKVKETMHYINIGIVDATVTQAPFNQGYFSLKYIFEYEMIYNRKKKIDDYICPTHIYIKENL
jgi:LacI family transcriptional regulator